MHKRAAERLEGVKKKKKGQFKTENSFEFMSTNTDGFTCNRVELSVQTTFTCVKALECVSTLRCARVLWFQAGCVD